MKNKHYEKKDRKERYVKKVNNVRIFANPSNDNKMDIYVNISGKSEYLMEHRYSQELFELCKDGIRLDELRRLVYKNRADGNFRSKVQKRRSRVFKNVISHLVDVADEYLVFETCLAA